MVTVCAQLRLESLVLVGRAHRERKKENRFRITKIQPMRGAVVVGLQARNLCVEWKFFQLQPRKYLIFIIFAQELERERRAGKYAEEEVVNKVDLWRVRR